MGNCISLNGLRGKTPFNTITGPGKVYVNIDLAKLRDVAEIDPLGAAIANAIEIGATRGGTTFTVEKEMRDVEFDGKRGAVKGLVVKESEQGILAVNFIEVDVTNTRLALPGSQAIVRANGYTEIKPGSCLQLTDYVNNVAIVAVHGNRNKPIVIVLENVLNAGNFELAIVDKDESNPAYEFRSHYSYDKPEEVPYEIFIANEDGFFSTLAASNVTAEQGAVGNVNLTTLWVGAYGDVALNDLTVTLLDFPSTITLGLTPVTVANGSTVAVALPITVAQAARVGVYEGQVKITGPGLLSQYLPLKVTVTLDSTP